MWLHHVGRLLVGTRYRDLYRAEKVISLKANISAKCDNLMGDC